MVHIIINPEGANEWVANLKEGENTVGRAEDNDVRIDEGGVSGHHCRIVVGQGAVTITDLNSTNGTHVGGQRIQETTAWSPGQIVHLGGLAVRLNGSSVAAPSAPSPAMAAPASPAVPKAGGPVRLRISGGPAAAAPAAAESPETESATAPQPAFVMAAAGTVCRFHAKSPARWSCPKCQKYFCELCVSTRSTSAGQSHVCRGCGVECVPVHVAASSFQGEKGFFGRLPGAFAYPFRGAGMLVLIAAAIVFSLLSAMSGIFSLLLTMAATGYLFLFLQNIIHSTAADDDRMPSMPDFDGLFGAFFTLAGTVVISFIVPVGLGIARLSGAEIPMNAFIASIFLSLLYFPMAFLAVAILDSVAAANPLVVIPSILKVPVHYVVTVIILCGVFGIRLLGDAAASAAGQITYTTTDMSVLVVALVGRALWSFVSIYLLTVGMRILGLLYLTQKEKLGWL